MEVYVFWWIIFGLITGTIAAKKRRSFIVWGIFGALMFIIAFPAILIVKAIPEAVCPFCKNGVKAGATVCQHCRSNITV